MEAPVRTTVHTTCSPWVVRADDEHVVRELHASIDRDVVLNPAHAQDDAVSTNAFLPRVQSSPISVAADVALCLTLVPSPSSAPPG
jgi:hypothetical protein